MTIFAKTYNNYNMEYSKFTTEAEQNALNEKYAGVIFE